MSSNLISATKCLNGKRHRWKIIEFSNPKGGFFYGRTDWCAECGALTEFTKDLWSKRWNRCVDDETGVYHIIIPDILKRK